MPEPIPLSAVWTPPPFPAAVLIAPGYGDSGVDHWQTHWQATIPGASRVHQRDWLRPRCGEWVAALDTAVDTAAQGGEEIILVAHSLACLTVAHWAAGLGRRPRPGAPQGLATRIRLGFLVAPPDPQGVAFPPEAEGFQPMPDEPLGFPAQLLASANDPYASLDFARALATRWEAEFVHLGEAGHVNVGSGHGPWPQGLARLVAGCAASR